MNFVVEMMYLGKEERTSGKTGKQYFMVKLLNASTGEIFEFYVKGDNTFVLDETNKLAVATVCKVALKLSSNRGNAQVDLTGVKTK